MSMIMKFLSVALLVLAVLIMLCIIFAPVIIYNKGKKDNQEVSFVEFIVDYVEELGQVTIYMLVFCALIMCISYTFCFLGAN